MNYFLSTNEYSSLKLKRAAEGLLLLLDPDDLFQLSIAGWRHTSTFTSMFIACMSFQIEKYKACHVSDSKFILIFSIIIYV